jgi:hypothetical protein
MAQFKVGDKAIFLSNGIEMEVQIVGGTPGGNYAVETTDGEHRTYMARPSTLLRLKGPFFDVRGLVFTTSVNHPGEQGEIIKQGKGSDGARFFCVQFSDGSAEWLKEHDLCIEI